MHTSFLLCAAVMMMMINCYWWWLIFINILWQGSLTVAIIWWLFLNRVMDRIIYNKVKVHLRSTCKEPAMALHKFTLNLIILKLGCYINLYLNFQNWQPLHCSSAVITTIFNIQWGRMEGTRSRKRLNTSVVRKVEYLNMRLCFSCI